MSGRWIQPGRGLVATVAIIGSVVVGRHASVRGETAGTPPDVPPAEPAPACRFHAGTHAAGTPDFSAAPAPTKIPIKHVIVLMQENHSFGRLQVFGLPEAEGFRADFNNPDGGGRPDPGPGDEHPPADVQRGERWARSLYSLVTRSPLWPTTAMFITYDEGGGFFDRVAPEAGHRGCRPIAVAHL